MDSVADWLKRFILRSLIYIIGIIIVLIVIACIVFVVAQPKVNAFVDKEVKKYGVELEGWSVGLTGRANLHNVRFPLRNGIVLTARQVSARPPISSFKGAADFYDVKVDMEGMAIKIPRLSISGIEKNEKDLSIKSKMLQAIMQIGVSSISADNIEVVSSLNDMQGTVNIKDFAVNDLYKGKISYVGFKEMQTTSNLSKEKLAGSLQSGAISFKKIDVASAYSFLENSLSQNQSIIDILGPMSVGNLKLDANLTDGKQLHLALGRFSTEGFSVRNVDHPSIAQAKEALAILKDSSSTKQERNVAMKTFLQFFQTIAKINASMKNLFADTEVGKLSIDTIDVTPSNWNKVIPESILVTLDNAILDVSDSSNEKARALKEMGYDQLDLSFLMDLNWSEQNNTININELSFSSNEIGRAEVSGQFINVEPTFFSGDQTDMMIALSKMALHSLDISLNDYGFLDNIIKWEAPQAGLSETELRESIKEIAVKTPLSLLKGYSDADVISEVFGRFIDDPGTLKISMTSKDGNGVSLLDFMMAQSDPAMFLNKLNLKATTTGRAN